MSMETFIHLRGLPWSATAQEIMDFLSPIDVVGGPDGVHLTLSRDGRPSGQAYVELGNEDDVEEAKKLHNKHMGRRYIEVFKARSDEVEHALKRDQGGDEVDNESCVRLRGLPFGCSKEEILNFFDGLEVVANGISLPTDFQGRQTGEAYVQFVDRETAERALDKHKDRIGHRYIEIFKCNLSDVQSAMSNSRGRGGGGGGGGGGHYGGGFNSRPSPYDSRDRYGGQNRYGGGGGGGGRNRYDDFDSYNDGGYGGRGRMGGGSMRGGGGGGGGGSRSNRDGGHCVHMRGLPFKASESDIADFFRPLVPVDVCISKDNTGRPSGEADIEFECHEDAVKAMSRDKANMQHRYIELFLNSTPGGDSNGGSRDFGGYGNEMGGGRMDSRGDRNRGGRYSRY